METESGIDPNEPFYLRKLEEISVTEEPYFDVNCLHLKDFDTDLYRQLVCYPQVSLSLTYRNSKAMCI